MKPGEGAEEFMDSMVYSGILNKNSDIPGSCVPIRTAGVDWGSRLVLAERIVREPTGGALFCLNLNTLSRLIHTTLAALPLPHYAVKANSHPDLLSRMALQGVTHFDVASLEELLAVRKVAPHATCAFMNPVKSRDEIQKAVSLGVTTFALDSQDELDRLLSATQGVHGLCFIVRMKVSRGRAVYDMSGKFGATRDETKHLLARIVAGGIACGLTFHVGSQCLEPQAYATAIAEVAQLVREMAIPLSVLDVGGGFPARYGDSEPSLDLFGASIGEALTRAQDAWEPSLIVQSEPGRCVVAHAGSVAVQVIARKGNQLVLGDGKHGLLSELWWMRAMHPVRRIIRAGKVDDGAMVPMEEYSLAGPTCDSNDFFPGPYRLPLDMAAEDWLEVGCLGAYSLELATRFNGYGAFRLMTVDATSS
ncbi:MAG: alanine racemase [Magnetococcales bacterium]|nr:alanine racemase [Magnetococcales bacterium]MBF0323088.1 alanine racemase [Magnetococcales bacterium]